MGVSVMSGLIYQSLQAKGTAWGRDMGTSAYLRGAINKWPSRTRFPFSPGSSVGDGKRTGQQPAASRVGLFAHTYPLLP